MATPMDVRTAPDETADRPSPPPSPSPSAGSRRPLDRWLPFVPGVALGLAGALWRLDRHDLWLDEAYSLSAVHQPVRTVIDTHGTMAAYYALLRPWTAWSESASWMRLLSVLLAVAAIGVVVGIGARMRGRRTAAAVGLLTALSPLWLVHAREARSYGLVLLLVALGWWALDLALAADGNRAAARWWALHTAVCVVVPLAHGLAVAQIVPHLGAVALAGIGRRTWVRAGRGVVLSVVVTAALGASGAASEVGDWVDPLGWEQVGRVVSSFTSPDRLVAIALGGVVLVGAGRSLAALRRAPSGLARARLAVPVLWGLVPLLSIIALSVVRPALVPRYLIGSVPGVALLLVAAIERPSGASRPLPDGRDRRDRPRVMTLAVVVLAVALAAAQVDVHRRADDGWSTAAGVVAEGLRPGDTILLSRSTTTRPPFEAAWRDVAPAAPARLLPSDRPLGEVLRFEPGDATGTERWNEARRATGRIWVVGDVERLELDRLPSLTVDGVAGRPATHREVERWVRPGARATVVVVLLAPI